MTVTLSKHAHCEWANDYARAILRSDKYRIVVCKDGIQWIIQKRAGRRHGQPRWEGLAYCRSRSVLKRVWTGLQADLGCHRSWHMLDELPATFGGRRDG